MKKSKSLFRFIFAIVISILVIFSSVPCLAWHSGHYNRNQNYCRKNCIIITGVSVMTSVAAIGGLLYFALNDKDGS